MKTTAVIMAGGKGERFWPKSRAACPKQFLSLTTDGETMLRKTVSRLHPLVQPEDVYIVTNADYLPLVREQLPEIPPENLLAEPCSRNTAPAIGLAACIIQEKYGDAVMLVLPSDHLIHAEEMYIDTLRKAALAAEDGRNLVTLGITPTYPETGYGYIRYVKGSGRNGLYQVEHFAEKPDLETARSYLRERAYLWNSGMFIWKASAILYNLEQHLPELYNGLQPIRAAWGTPEFSAVLEANFCQLPCISIDYGVMEKAEHILTIPGSFGWDDVGSWLALERINQTDEAGNFLSGDVISVDSRNCTVSADTRLVAVLGLQDVIVVDTADALLICSKNSTQDIRKILSQLRAQKRSELL